MLCLYNVAGHDVQRSQFPSLLFLSENKFGFESIKHWARTQLRKISCTISRRTLFAPWATKTTMRAGVEGKGLDSLVLGPSPLCVHKFH